MLAKLKRPECYIGHGVFVFPDGYDYPVKRKITDIHVRYSENGWVVLDVVIERYHDWLQPTDVYMSKKEALFQYWKKEKELATRELLQHDNEMNFALRCIELAKNKFWLAHEKLRKIADR